MSEHAWTLENIAAFVACGLDAAEAERLERHVAECPECTAVLHKERALDQGLDALFAPARPGPALEDRMIHALRTETTARICARAGGASSACGAAAAVALGLTGAGMSRLMDEGELPFPGMAFPGRAFAANNLTQMGFVVLDDTHSEAESSRIYREEYNKAVDAEAMAKAAAERALSQLQGASSPRNTSGDAGITSMFKNGQDSPTNPDAPPPPFASEAVSREQLWPDWSGPGAERANLYSNQADLDKRKKEPFSDDYFQPIVLGFTEQKPDGSGAAKRGDKNQLGKEKEEGPPPPGTSKTDKPAPPMSDTPAPEAAAARKVIRSGEVEFEVESFDTALATVTKLVTGIKGAFVGTVNSDKLANGKVKGSIVVRVPPDNLDSLVLDLRKELGKNGELKGQRIGSQDITKQYTDLESRLKAARTMEQRFLQIIKEGKGEIKQLLEAEKELGIWRTKIEEFEGEIRYYASQVALGALTITLTEKEIRAAADLVESERVSAGLEVEDVDKERCVPALAAVAEAKGRVTKSELKQHSTTQFGAILQFDVAPESAGPLRDRLKQLGNMVRLEIDRVQQAEGGTAPAPRDARVRRGETSFDVRLYNLARVASRETATVQLAVADVPAGYRALRDVIERARGRVVTAQLNEHDRQKVTAQLDFEVYRAEESDILKALATTGDLLSREVSRAPESPNLTDAKVLFKTSLVSAASIPPRESATLGIEVGDVEAMAALFAAAVTEAQGRVIQSQVAHERSGRVTGRLVYDVPLSAAPGLIARFKEAGTVRVHETTRNPQAAEGKLALAHLEVTLSNAELIVPRDDGLWPQVRKGLSYSVTVLSLSVTWLIFGLCVLLPWALVGYGGYRLVRRLFRVPPEPVVPPAPAP